MVDFTQIQKEGFLQVDAAKYNVSVTLTKDVLVRLYCSVSRKAEAQAGQEAIQDMAIQDVYVGYISLENGRKIIEMGQGEDIAKHLEVFESISKEVLSN